MLSPDVKFDAAYDETCVPIENLFTRDAHIVLIRKHRQWSDGKMVKESNPCKPADKPAAMLQALVEST